MIPDRVRPNFGLTQDKPKYLDSAKRGWSISLVGRAESEALIKQCKELLNSEKVQDAILPAAQLVRDVAKHLVNIGPGKRKGGEPRRHLRDLIFATKGRKPNSGVIGTIESMYGEGPSVIMGVDLKQAPHAHLIEFGHRQAVGGQVRSEKKKMGKVVGYVPAYPFIRPAVAACRAMIVRIIESALVRLLAPYSSNR